ncbi:MAG TPA: HlyD family efflux transporter periplasmic adaptor subunit [Longimicrobiaceae bacterium]|nr:HlyD family efflux transporter periplasmic adaptor subunit [Longimicrobiaceae bacterium]
MPSPPIPWWRLDDTLEALLAEHARPRAVVYSGLVVLLAVGCAVLPLVHVEVSTSARGLVRPAVERVEVAAPATGFVERSEIDEDRVVHAGDTLAVLRSRPIRSRAGLLESRLREKQDEARDLEVLVSGADRPVRTARYRDEMLASREGTRENRLQTEQAERELRRVRALAGRGLASRSEVEARQLARDRLGSEHLQQVSRDRARWQGALVTVRGEIADLRDQIVQLEDDRDRSFVLATVNGTLAETLSLSAGSFVQVGEELCVISPSATLVAEVYVSPRDIGLIHRGMPVAMQVDAFQYTEWGFLHGRVAEVPSDYALVDQRAVFRVTVRLDAAELRLPSGARGRLRKGMTLSAHFQVARRSLWQLLRDRATDWLDPLHPTPAPRKSAV